MTTLVAVGGGFLLAVLWFDLMFDVQARRLDEPGGDARLASIADYYRRVTVEAYPANRLVAAMMLLTIAGSVVLLWRTPSLRAFVALLLVVAPVALARARIVPNAMRLGRREDPLDVQRALARTILRDHLACWAAIATFLVLRLW